MLSILVDTKRASLHGMAETEAGSQSEASRSTAKVENLSQHPCCNNCLSNDGSCGIARNQEPINGSPASLVHTTSGEREVRRARPSCSSVRSRSAITGAHTAKEGVRVVEESFSWYELKNGNEARRGLHGAGLTLADDSKLSPPAMELWEATSSKQLHVISVSKVTGGAVHSA